MSETLQDVLTAMDSAAAEVALANEKALKQAVAMGKVHPSREGQDVSELTAARTRLENEKAELENRERNEALAERLAELRERGLASLESEREAIEAALYQAQLAEGPQAEQWALAEARRVFVQEDIQRMDPADIPAYLELARAAGDDVGAWLIARAAERHLAELHAQEVAAGELLGDAGRALAELRELTTSPALAAHRQKVARLAALRLDLEKPRGEVEQTSARTEFAAIMGLRAEDVPDLDFTP